MDRVWRVLRCCPIDPGYCQDSIADISIKKPFISLLYSTTVFPINALFNANINRFGGRLTVSEMCLDTAWWVIKSIGETPMKEYWALLISWFLFSKLPWIGHKVPYSRVSVGCQEGARGMSGVV